MADEEQKTETPEEQPTEATTEKSAVAPDDSDTVAGHTGESLDTTDGEAKDTTNTPADNLKPDKTMAERVQGVIGGMNIYLMIFVLVFLLAGFATFAIIKASKKQTDITIKGQTLSQEDLQQIKNTDASVGDAKQTLTIASNAIFNGSVLVKNNLDVAGTIRVGGALALPGLSVSGTSSFENIQASNNISAAGNGAIQGTLTVQKDLTVGGNATFAGTITASRISIDKFVLNGDIQLNRHIDAGGAIPRVTAGPAVGGAGTVSISGSDTAGTVNLNFGFGLAGGILANITFTNAFNETPHVVITPVGSNCANLNYYVNRTTGGFSIGTTNAGTNGSCAFDFIAID